MYVYDIEQVMRMTDDETCIFQKKYQIIVLHIALFLSALLWLSQADSKKIENKQKKKVLLVK